MIELDKLWIGDKLKIVSNDLVVTFEGIAGQKAIVKDTKGQVFHVKVSDLEAYEESENEEILFEKEEVSNSPQHHLLPTTIDLHIEKLNPNLVYSPAQGILQYQINALEKYLNQVEVQGVSYITIIHGKGAGILKKEVLHLLKFRPKVKHFIEVNDGGAVEVIYY